MHSELKTIVENMMAIDTIMTLQKESVIDVKVFKQVWPSTTLGFGGMGGDAMTSAFTTIVTTDEFVYYVFFNGSLAYVVDDPTKKFKEDMLNCNMADVATAKKLY